MAIAPTSLDPAACGSRPKASPGLKRSIARTAANVMIPSTIPLIKNRPSEIETNWLYRNPGERQLR